MKTINIKLEELVCPMCSTKIEKGLKKEKGIIDVTVSYNNAKAKVSYNEDEISIEKITDIISDLGYDVLDVK